MKYIVAIGITVVLAVLGWRIPATLSSDAIGMAIGMLFGILAGIPTALLLLASQHRDPVAPPSRGWQLQPMPDGTLMARRRRDGLLVRIEIDDPLHKQLMGK